MKNEKKRKKKRKEGRESEKKALCCSDLFYLERPSNLWAEEVTEKRRAGGNDIHVQAGWKWLCVVTSVSLHHLHTFLSAFKAHFSWHTFAMAFAGVCGGI